MVKTNEILGASPITDPFVMDKVTGLWMHYSKAINTWIGHIEFKSGNTTGKQEFREEGDEALPTLIKKMREFLEFVEKLS